MYNKNSYMIIMNSTFMVYSIEGTKKNSFYTCSLIVVQLSIDYYQGRMREEGMQLTISPTCEQKLYSIYL